MERWQNLSGRAIVSLDLVKSRKQLACGIPPGHAARPSQGCCAHAGAQSRAAEDAFNGSEPTLTVSWVDRKRAFAQQLRQRALRRGHYRRAAGRGLNSRK